MKHEHVSNRSVCHLFSVGARSSEARVVISSDAPPKRRPGYGCPFSIVGANGGRCPAPLACVSSGTGQTRSLGTAFTIDDTRVDWRSQVSQGLFLPLPRRVPRP